MVVVSAAIAFCAVTAVAASPKREVNAPLYTFRMEQASSNMNFLPTAMNGFEYITEKGYVLDCAGKEYCNNVKPLASENPDTVCTCIIITCEETCYTCSTCDSTCPATCPYTCDDATCNAGQTCPYTCSETCPVITCSSTCWETCGPPITCGSSHC